MSRRTAMFVRKLTCHTSVRICWLWLACLALCPIATAQLTVVNPKGVDVPEERAQLLLRLSCKVAAEEFHLKHAETEFPVTLVLGGDREEYTGDDKNQVYTIYMKQWDESRFTSATTMMAVRRLALPARGQMISEVLRRAHSITPVRVKDLRPGGAGGKGK